MKGANVTMFPLQGAPGDFSHTVKVTTSKEGKLHGLTFLPALRSISAEQFADLQNQVARILENENGELAPETLPALPGSLQGLAKADPDAKGLRALVGRLGKITSRNMSAEEKQTVDEIVAGVNKLFKGGK